jgi:hypothetical protein
LEYHIDAIDAAPSAAPAPATVDVAVAVVTATVVSDAATVVTVAAAVRSVELLGMGDDVVKVPLLRFAWHTLHTFELRKREIRYVNPKEGEERGRNERRTPPIQTPPQPLKVFSNKAFSNIEQSKCIQHE